MGTSFFKTLEQADAGERHDTDVVLSQLTYNSEGLIPAIAQDADTGAVLMMAWMNRQSIEETLSTGQVCYWSRSRKAYWRKGEESGHVQTLVRMEADCDGDTLLLAVNQLGGACHTHRDSCFYLEIGATDSTVTSSCPTA